MANIVKFERTGFNVDSVLSRTKDEFVRTFRGRMFRNRRVADRDIMLKRVYDLCKQEREKGATS